MAPSSNRAVSFNFDLGETVDMLRQTVEAFAQNEIAPRAAEADQRAEFPHDLWRKFGAVGLLGITAELLTSKVTSSQAHFAADFAEAIAAVTHSAREGDMIMTLGAGSVSQLAAQILAALEAA